jgi:hypothetical protein
MPANSKKRYAKNSKGKPQIELRATCPDQSGYRAAAVLSSTMCGFFLTCH